MLEVGVKAPDFTLKDKDGKEVALSSFRGKIFIRRIIRRGAPGRPVRLQGLMPGLRRGMWRL